jgi:hypothetical protein
VYLGSMAQDQCPDCKGPMVPLLTSLVCAKECDLQPEPKGITFSKPLDWVWLPSGVPVDEHVAQTWEELMKVR